MSESSEQESIMGAEQTKLTPEQKEEFFKAFKVSESEYQSIMTAFKQRADANGCISREAFVDSVSHTSHPELAGMIFDVFDKDGNATMDLREYLVMCGMTRAGTVEQRLAASFELFDENGDGVISQDEVRKILRLLVQQKMAMARFQATGHKCSASSQVLDEKTLASIDRVVTATFAKVDTDKNGTIDKDEFVQGFATHPEICSFFKQF